MKFNTPNILTIIRIALTPIFLVLLLTEELPHRFLLSCIIFVIGAITDAADGHFARKNHQITNFGKFLDPIADKILTTSALLAFMQMGLCDIWIVMLVLTREFAIASVRMIAAANGVVIPANTWGKVKTASQMIFTVIILLMGEAWEIVAIKLPELLEILPDLALISNALLWITAILTIVSGVIYLNDSKKIIDFTK